MLATDKFEDGRSKKVIFIAHCILNQNSISDGTAVFPATFKDVIKILLDADIGIVQMPCPELCCLGLNRGNNDGADVPVVIENTRIRKEMQKAESYKMLMVQVEYVMKQITECLRLRDNRDYWCKSFAKLRCGNHIRF